MKLEEQHLVKILSATSHREWKLRDYTGGMALVLVLVLVLVGQVLSYQLGTYHHGHLLNPPTKDLTMRLLQLSLQNFLSYQDEQTISLDRQGLVGIFGENTDSRFSSNGCGKSGIMDGITWCFWGQTLRGVGSNDVINDVTKKNCEVTLTAEDGNNSFKVTRYLKKSKVKKGNDLLLEVNGVDVTKGTKAETQVLIDELIGINFGTFTQSVLLSASSKPFCSLTDAEQKGVLEDILNIDVLRKAQAVVKDRVTLAKAELSGVLVAVSKLENFIAGTKDDLVSLGKRAEAYDRDQAARAAILQKSIESAERLVEESKAARVPLDKLIAERADMDSDEQAVLGDMDDYSTQINDSKAKVQENLSKLSLKMMEYSTMVRVETTTLQKLSKLAGTVCSTCAQVIDVEDAEKQMAQLEEAINGSTAQLDQLDTLGAKLKLAGEVEVKPLQDALVPLHSELNDLRGDMLQNSKKGAELKLLCAQEASRVQRLADLKDSTNKEVQAPYADLIEEGKENMAKRVLELEVHKKKEAELALLLKGLYFWDVGFGNKGLKSYIMDNVIPFLNERAQKYIDVMANGAFTISFSTQTLLKNGYTKEKFQVILKNANGSDVYKGNSSGEKRRADVAIGWALADLAATRASKPIRFRGLDEPFENLDRAGIDSVFKLLRYATEEYETVFVITHDEDLRARFQREIIVQKRLGKSTIRQKTFSS
ncbi:MAG: AAA family ATPase [Sulfurovum sp.]|nr:AAA family ATPase [Sulfurovum sp.]